MPRGFSLSPAAYCSLVSTVPSALLFRSHSEGQPGVLSCEGLRAFAEQDGVEALAAEAHQPLTASSPSADVSEAIMPSEVVIIKVRLRRYVGA